MSVISTGAPMVAAAHRAEPMKWLMRARTSHDAHGVPASSWSGRTRASTARVLTKDRLSCWTYTVFRLLSTADDPLATVRDTDVCDTDVCDTDVCDTDTATSRSRQVAGPLKEVDLPAPDKES